MEPASLAKEDDFIQRTASRFFLITPSRAHARVGVGKNERRADPVPQRDNEVSKFDLVVWKPRCL
jgi:hypothetical protein